MIFHVYIVNEPTIHHAYVDQHHHTNEYDASKKSNYKTAVNSVICFPLLSVTVMSQCPELMPIANFS